MEFWKYFWTTFLLIAGASFAFITCVVTVKGFRDLRDMFRQLSKQRQDSGE